MKFTLSAARTTTAVVALFLALAVPALAARPLGNCVTC
jgi:hypothetical protein